jgi:hypothetical protein
MRLHTPYHCQCYGLALFSDDYHSVDTDKLQLALNCTHLSTAASAVELLESWPLKDQRAAHRLLPTAAANQHADRLLFDLLSCNSMQQHLGAATQEAVITLLLARESDIRERVARSMLDFLTFVGMKPAAVQLAGEIVARLLLAELQAGNFEVVQCFTYEPTEVLRAITSDQVESMLAAALQGANQQCRCGMRDAQLLSKRAAKRVQRCVRELCRLPGAAALSSTAVSKLLQAALQLQDWGSSRTVAALCKLPAAEGMCTKDVVQLLQAASAQRRVWNTASGAALESLHRLLAATHHRNNADAAELIAAAVECGAGTALGELCKLQAVQKLSCAAVLAALEAALKAGGCLCTGIEQMCKLPAAQQLSSEAVAQLLQAAAGHKDCICRMLLLSLPAAKAAA